MDYGHDIVTNPLGYTPPNPMSSVGALNLLKKDTKEITDKFKKDIKRKFTQQQLNTLVAIRYNCGALSQFDELLYMLENGNYDRKKLTNSINNYYRGLVQKNPANNKYLNGWLNRTEKMMNVFFDGSYGEMPIDAVNGKVKN